MKRIVQCPKCQTKLSVVDLGKPIKQKCPKCKENFEVESEDAKAADTKKEPAADSAPVAAGVDLKPDVKAEPQAENKTAAEAKADSKAEAKPEIKPEPKSDAKTDGKPEVKSDAKPDTKAQAKDAAAPKPVSKPAVPRTAPALDTIPRPEVHASHCGVSMMQIVTIIVLLVFVIIMQIKSARFADRRFYDLEKQLIEIKRTMPTSANR